VVLYISQQQLQAVSYAQPWLLSVLLMLLYLLFVALFEGRKIALKA